ncbi:MAG: hypothetical protein ACK5WW_02910 [Brevundimonas sp.]|jgi:hypothetical protein|uniref:hypothetical protein n=1 Tax=Brevundimonas sp. TaxID=1871086 RepID=UPI00391C0014
MTEKLEMALQKVNRIAGRGEAIGEAIKVVSAMAISGMGIDDVLAWLEAEQTRNILNLEEAGKELAAALPPKL